MEKNYLRKKDILGLILFGILIGTLIFVGRQFDFHNVLLWFEKGNIEKFGVLAPIVFILVYIALIVSLVPSAPLNILSGAVFGSFFGTLYSLVAVVLGGAVSFLIARTLGESLVSKFIENESEFLHKYNRKISEDGWEVVLLFRIIPFFPISGLNYLFGLSKMKFRSYLLGSIVGTIPGIFILSFFGDSLSNLNLKKIILVGVLFIMVGLVSWLYKRKIQNI